MRRRLSAFFLAALLLGTGLVSPGSLRQFCEDHGRFCMEFAFAEPSCAEVEASNSDCCGETPCEGGRCLAAPFPGEWVSPSAKGELDPPRWVEHAGMEAAGPRSASAGSPEFANLRTHPEAPPPARGRPLLAWLMVRLI